MVALGVLPFGGNVMVCILVVTRSYHLQKFGRQRELVAVVMGYFSP